MFLSAEGIERDGNVEIGVALNPAGDRLVAGGKVTAVRPSPDGLLVDCDVWPARDGTEAVLAGAATVLMSG